MARVSIESVNAGYGTTQVLHDLTFSFGDAEVVALLGPNGSGKTTLIRTINNILQPLSGTVSINEKRVCDLSQLEISQLVALVPQREETLFDFTVKQMVEMGRFPWGDQSNGHTEAAIAKLHLDDLQSRMFSSLSGGERQRVLMARALAQDTPIILMDEPTAHMDIGYQIASLGLLNELSEEGRTILVAVHDLNLASGFSSRSVLMFDGRIVLDGSTNDVLTSNDIEQVFGARFSHVTEHSSGRTVLVPEFLNPRDKSPNPKRIHLIGGGGSAAPLLGHLWQSGHYLSLGVAHDGDSDTAAAHRMGIPCATVAPFSQITKEASDQAEIMADDADWAILCPAPFASGNLENLRLAGRLLARGKTVVLLPEPETWDYSGGEAQQLRQDLIDSGAIESNLTDVLNTLDEVN